VPCTEDIKPYYVPLANDSTLVFESRFESGNLWMAMKTSENEYDLILQNDINTKGHTQWFYFQVSNTTANLSVTFNILNFSKSGSLYNSGMKVMVYSSMSQSWSRGGTNISYFPNGIKKNKKNKTYYTMSFTYKFINANDVIYFAYSSPYTFTDIMKYLQALEDDEIVKEYFKRRLLTHSIAGNRCDYITITAAGSPEEVKERKGVFISARVHPGETVGSWMMHGVLEFLTGPSDEAAALRKNFIFKIVPMLNPDGVINGNYRCNLAGVDLNRQWKRPDKLLHPTIFAAKKLIKTFASQRQIALICDLHGHSRRKNIFMYGCSDPDYPELTREFPYVLSKLSSFFSYKSCSFRMQRSKESTLRIAVFNETKVFNTYTLESTFCGCDFGELAGLHLTTEDLKTMGKDLCMALIVCNNISIPSTIPIEFSKEKIIQEIKDAKFTNEINNESSSGSDSDPSEDNLDKNEVKKILEPPKRRVNSDTKPKKRI
jgi:cytosolic carboxypeptidase protein 2/3